MATSTSHCRPKSNRHPRVLFVALQFGRLGGLEIYTLDLVQTMRQLGCDVDVWSVIDSRNSVTDGIEAIALAPRLRVLRSLYYRYLWERLLQRRLAAVVAEHDLVIAGHVNVLPSVYRASRATPYWAWTYGLDIWGDWSPAVEEALKKAHRIGTISQYTRLSITKRLPDARIALIPNSVDTDRFKPCQTSRHSNNPLILLTVGRLSSRDSYKGQDVVIRALPHIQKRFGHPVEYWIVGTGDDQPRLRKLARDMDVEDRVCFLGRVPDAELVSVYQACDVFVMPSKTERYPDGSWAGEGFGTVYIEASACGKPVVGSNQGGAAEAVVDGVTGFTVDPTSVDAISEAVCMLLNDPTLCQTMGEAGRRYVVENFSRPVFEERVAVLLAESGLMG